MVLQSEIEQHMMGVGTSSAWAAMEDATAAILRSFGFDVRVTARTKDGGVDIILDYSSDDTVFVQVKHSRNKVDVRVLRELVGTMMLGGVHKGLLVTSSTFTEGAHALKDTADLRGLPVELVDGERFLSALKLSTRLQAPTLAEVLAVAAPLVTLTQEEIQI
jgi:HJR/Mrr/RecB family endonuclease